MKRETAELLANTAANNGIGLTARHDYSGRGMMGSKTSAVSFDRIAVLLRVAVLAGHSMERGDLERFAEEIGSITMDNSGRGIVAY